MPARLKRHKKALILSSLVTLLPIAAGVFLWSRLPEQMPVHWNASGVATGFAPRIVAVFGLPILFLAVHWLCLAVTAADPKNRVQNERVLAVICWLIPALSLVTGGMLYSSALGYALDSQRILVAVLGILFAVVGNNLPKTTQNSSIGIRLPWTLADEENWIRTHRLAGPLWVAGGLVLAIDAFLPQTAYAAVMFVDLAVMALLPVFFSWQMSRRRKP